MDNQNDTSQNRINPEIIKTESKNLSGDDSTESLAKKKIIEQYLAYGFGIVFVSIMLAIAIFIPNPTPFSYMVFKIILALAAAGIAAFIPGFLDVQISNFLRAGGAIAVFVIVFFFNPASLTTTPPKPNPSISITKDNGDTLGFVINSLTNDDNQGSPIFSNCSESVKMARLKPISIEASDIKNIINKLQFNLEASNTAQIYTVELTEKGYEIKCI